MENGLRDELYFRWRRYGSGGGGDLPWTTFTGNPLEFDAPKAHALKYCVVDIEPIQDLHGQDAPYPAGGGANKWDEEWELGQYNNSTGAPYPANDCIRTKNAISVQPNTVYYTTYGGGNMQVFFYEADDTFISQTWVGVNNLITTPSNCGKLRFRCASAYGTTYLDNISINYPSTDTAYHPYENLCPISGWTGAKLWGTGENLFGGLPFAQVFLDNQSSATINTTAKTVYHPYIPSSGTHFNLFNVFKENEQYTIIVKGDNSLRKPNLSIVYTDETQTLLQDFDSTSHGVSVTTSTQGKTVKSIRTVSQGDAVTYYYDSCGIFEGNLTADDFTPYSGTSLTLSWSDYGTVYGGYVTVAEDGSVDLYASGEKEYFDTTESGIILSQINSFNPVNSSVSVIGEFARITFAIRTEVDQSKYNRASNSYAEKMCNLAKHYFAYNDQSTHWYRNTVLYLFLPTAICGSTAQSVYDYLVSIKDTTPLSFWIPYNEPILVAHLAPVTPPTAVVGINTMWTDGDSLTVEARGTAVELNALQSLNMLLGNRYVNNHTEEDVSDEEALSILLGGNR